VKAVLTGNESAAWGARLSRPKIVAAYPITPQTTIVEKIADFIANGEMDATMIHVESEHSAMATCISAEATGVRTYTATSSQGLALMHEMLIWAAGARLPIVMSVVNRAFAPPWSIWSDHMDTVAERDTGWLQFYAENNQETLDSVILAYRIAEDRDVLLPAMVTEEAFILSHTVEPVEIPDQGAVDDYLPPLDLPHRLRPGEPVGYGSLMMPDQYMEIRYRMARAMRRARRVEEKAYEDFWDTFGRLYAPVEEYKMDGADVALVIMGSIASTAKDVVDSLRERGRKVGLLRIRTFRPFPAEEVRKALSSMDAVAVLDRSYTFGHLGALATEVRSALYGSSPPIKNYIVGLGGRDVRVRDLEWIVSDIEKVAKEGLDREITWVNLRGGEE